MMCSMVIKYKNVSLKRLLAVCLLFSSLLICAEDINYRIIEDTPIWLNEGFQTQENFALVLKKDEIVADGSVATYVSSIDDVNVYFSECFYNGEDYSVPIKGLVPAETTDLFSDSFLRQFDGSENNRWIMSYFLDVLRSQNRNTILKYRSEYVQWLIDDLSSGLEQYDISSSFSTHENVVIFQSGISISPENYQGWRFYIKRITALPNGYKITVKGDSHFQEWFDGITLMTLPWPNPSEKEFFDLYLIPDGDYLDMYLNSMDNHFATFAKVDQNFADQLSDLFDNISSDLSTIVWPKRANKTHRIGRSCIVVESLRLRNQESTESETIMTMQPGTAVKIIDLGKQQTIDGITANWVNVSLEDGTAGWCFGGYLVEVPEERNDSVSERAEKAQTEAIIESDDKSGNENKNESTNPEIIIAAGCVVLLLVLLIGVTVMARRKRD